MERDLQAGFRIDHVHAASRSAHAAPRSLTRIRLFLLPLVLPFLPYGYSENCSFKLPRIRCQKYAPGAKHHRGQDRRQLKGARRGYPADRAQDLTQQFFIRVLEGRYLDRADPEKGRFRAFILTSLKFFLSDEADRDRAQKRGGGNVLPLEISSGEERYQRDSAHNETPERIFERRWALSVIDRVMDRLRDEFLQHGRLDHFNRLKVFLLDQGETPYAALARELGRSEGALKVAIHRLRKRYRDLFRQEIAETVADPAEVESELRFLAGLKRII